MKVLLLKDVYNLGRAGEVKKVANGYGRNYLIPQGLVVLATPGALKQADRIMAKAAVERDVLNEEFGSVAELLEGVEFIFAAKAGETGKLYGSITTQMVADVAGEKAGVEINRRQIDSQPLRMLGLHTVAVRLTMDLIPEITVLIHREGESPDVARAAALAAAEEDVEETFDDSAPMYDEVLPEYLEDESDEEYVTEEEIEAEEEPEAELETETGDEPAAEEEPETETGDEPEAEEESEAEAEDETEAEEDSEAE